MAASGGGEIFLRAFSISQFEIGTVQVAFGSQIVGAGDITLSIDTATGEDILHVSPIPPSPNGGSATVQVQVLTPAGATNGIAFSYVSGASVPIAFSSQVIGSLPGATCLAFAGPNTLYAGTQDGRIVTFVFNPVTFQVVSSSSVTVAPGQSILGIEIDPYKHRVGSPRIFFTTNLLFVHGQFFNGRICVWEGGNSVTELVTGLPVQQDHDHGVNGMAHTTDGRLLVQIGGATNAGVTDNRIGGMAETPLSAATLQIDIHRPNFNGAVSHINTFGDGSFSARSDNAHVSLFATGQRNSFDIAYNEVHDEFYATDNGPNIGFGHPSFTCTAEGNADVESPDEINLVREGHYYGHPNRNRGQCSYVNSNTPQAFNPATQSSVTHAIAIVPPSTNGILGYTATNFGSQMRGDLVTGQYLGSVQRLGLSPNGFSVVEQQQLLAPGGLAVTEGPRGAIFAVRITTGALTVLMPTDIGTSGPGHVGHRVQNIWPSRGVWPRTGQETVTLYLFGVWTAGPTLATPAVGQVTVAGVTCTVSQVTSVRCPLSPPRSLCFTFFFVGWLSSPFMGPKLLIMMCRF